MRGVTAAVQIQGRVERISTHTPHAGRDSCRHVPTRPCNISTHTPHAGRDDGDIMCAALDAFQLTRPMRGVTSDRRSSDLPCTFQLTRPMRGVTCGTSSERMSLQFQLTRPMRGVTYYLHPLFILVVISTHTPHAGRDLSTFSNIRGFDISTHTPHAGRDIFSHISRSREIISTHTPHAGRDQCDFVSVRI